MRAYLVRLMAVILIFLLISILANVFGHKLINKKMSQRNVVVDRINVEIKEKVTEKISAGFLTNSVIGDNVIDTEQIVNDVFFLKKNQWEALYGKESCPENVKLLVLDNYESYQEAILAYQNEKKPRYNKNVEIGGDGSKIRGIYTSNDYLIGIVEYEFKDTTYNKIIIIMNICLAAVMLLVLIYSLWIYRKVIVPFNRLSDYPERLSKGGTIEKLPVSRDKFFGKYAWGMNMLSDKLENDQETIRRISDEHQKLVTVLVHGIKTPAANIKLFSEAIATGLYDPEGKINEKDAELAGKIEKNADEIERIVSQAVNAANEVIFEYNPDVKPFYRNEIESYIRDEYGNNLKVNRIPFSVEAEGNPLIHSDLDGVCRIIRQLVDNAIKYGDGTGITLKMKKTDEGNFISISNKGETLPESELPFVFNSMWRGSNSRDVKGSGVGLYEARFIARKLGGDLKMRGDENETQVTLFLPSA